MAKKRFTRSTQLYDELPEDCHLRKGVPYTEGEVFELFKDTIKGVALQYTAFYSKSFQITESGNKPVSHVVTIGWNHGILLERKEIGWVLDSIYAYGSGDTNESKAYRLWGAKNDRVTTLFTPRTEQLAGKDWRIYDLSDEELHVGRVVTFGITSCSFACVWDDEMNFLAVSHVAFSPKIPLFWMVKHRQARAVKKKSVAPRHSESVVAKNVHLNLLASLNATPGELSKFTQPELPHADEFDVDAQAILRGPEELGTKYGDEAPFRTHPYVVLAFPRIHREGGVLYEGALGYNNTTSLQNVERPPIHTMGPAVREIKMFGLAHEQNMTTPIAQELVNRVAALVDGTYGFQELHQDTIREIHTTDSGEKSSSGVFEYKTPLFLALEKCAPDFSACAFLTDKQRATYRFIEAICKDPDKGPLIATTHAAMLRAWARHQLGWSFPIETLHELAEEEEDEVTEESALGSVEQINEDFAKILDELPSSSGVTGSTGGTGGNGK